MQRRASAALGAGVLLALVTLSGCGSTHRSAAAPRATVTTTAIPSDAAQLAPGPAVVSETPIGWLRLTSPTDADLAQAAHTARVVILNPWETRALHLLKTANPALVVLCYKDVSSTRSYAVTNGVDDAILPSGLGFAASQSDEALFAHDAAGKRIEWVSYPGQWQMAVWNPDYQRAWVAAVTTEVEAAGWDGIEADNANSSLGGYAPGVTLEQGRTDADIAAGTEAIVMQTRAAFAAKGLKVVPNIPDGRLDPARFVVMAGSDGALEEHLAHVGVDVGKDYLDSADPSGWAEQVQLLSALPDTAVRFAVTAVAPGDEQAVRFGLATFLLATGGVGPAGWTGVAHDAYVGYPVDGLQQVDLGDPTGAPEPRDDGTWARDFARGVVVVNPTAAAVETTVAGVKQTIPAHDAVIMNTTGG